MDEKTAIFDIIVPWLKIAGYHTYIKDNFIVKNTGGRRPDIVCEKNGVWTAIEAKTSDASEILKAHKIIDYAREYSGGGNYFTNNHKIIITNFLVATEFSKVGRLFKFDTILSGEESKHRRIDYQKKHFLFPYTEYQRSSFFVRQIFNKWTELEELRNESINIGVLLSTCNDKDTMTKNIPIPKMFVEHCSKRSNKWNTWWKQPCLF